MLTVLALRDIRPEIEPPDRDPGFLSLVAALLRAAARASRGRTAARLSGSSTAWPHVPR